MMDLYRNAAERNPSWGKFLYYFFRSLLVCLVLIGSFGMFYLIGLDYSFLLQRLCPAFIFFFISILFTEKKWFSFVGYYVSLALCIMAMQDPAMYGLCEGSLESTARSNPQPAASAAAVPPGPAQPLGPPVPVVQGLPVVVGSPAALLAVNEIVELLEPRVNMLTERAGVVIGPGDQHLAYLRRTSLSILHDIIPLTNPDVQVLGEFGNNLRANPRYVDSLIVDRLTNQNMN
jgi:hypothetical protein